MTSIFNFTLFETHEDILAWDTSWGYQKGQSLSRPLRSPLVLLLIDYSYNSGKADGRIAKLMTCNYQSRTSREEPHSALESVKRSRVALTFELAWEANLPQDSEKSEQ